MSQDKMLNLSNADAIKKLRELVKDIDMCLFATDLGKGDGSTARPMSTAEVDDNGTIWFLSPRDSEKNHDIEKDQHVQLYYSHPGKASYLVVNGTASISFDKKKIEELWNPLAKAWFKEGKDDPSISLIRVDNVDGYFWDTTGNRMINFVKIIASAATGKTLLKAEEGELHVR